LGRRKSARPVSHDSSHAIESGETRGKSAADTGTTSSDVTNAQARGPSRSRTIGQAEQTLHEFK